MKKFLASLVTAVTLIVTSLVTPAHAQTSDIFAAYTAGRSVAVARTADDTDPVLLIKYVGTLNGTVEVSAAGDITLKTGAVSSEAVDSTVKCPSGGSSGVIDVSDTACNTVGEVVNAINASANWVAVPIAALLSDDINCGGSGCLLLTAATSAATNDGVTLLADTDVIKTSTIALLPPEYFTIAPYLAGRPAASVALRTNPFPFRTFLAASNATSTYGSGTSTWSVIEVRPNYLKAGSTETATTLYGNVAGGATTVNKTFVALSDNNRILTNDSTKLLIRLTNSAALGTVTNYAFGYTYTLGR